MKHFRLPLTGIMLCAAILPSTAADIAMPVIAMPVQTKPGEALHAAVTDMPDIIDMSYADPKTWHRLPPAAQVRDQVLAQEWEFANRVGSRTRPF